MLCGFCSPHERSDMREQHSRMSLRSSGLQCFAFRKGDAHEVEIVDYHRG
jgi:hypothetical protein